MVVGHLDTIYSMTITLNATSRTETGKKTERLRAEGNLPAVMYGPKLAPTALTISKKEFDKVLKEAGETTVVTIKGAGTPTDVLIHEVAFDARRGGVVHVDFYAIQAGQKLTVHVPLTFVGEAPAVKLGGNVTKVLHEIEVEAEATHLPKEIEVDITGLVDLTSQIHVRDLTIPKGVEVKNDADDVVALIQEVVEEKEEAPEAPDMSAIEVEKKGKTEEEPAA
jgi:large subunit ribosomal protein L25